MKRFILSIAMLLTVCISTMAMSYEQARDRALFLTDKMAYELNLNDEQYEAAYEVNLDYLMSINTYDDLYGTYWTRRNLDLSYILYDWQYTSFCAASYFYRPLSWVDGIWRFGIYARYPNRAYFYFGRPDFYISYMGGHSWRMNGGQSWYHGRSFGPRPGESRFGMRDRFDRGDFNGPRNNSHFDNNRRNNGNNSRYGSNDNNRNGHFDRNDGNNNRNDNSSRFNRNDNNNNNRGTGSNGGFSGNRNGNTGTTNRQNRNLDNVRMQNQNHNERVGTSSISSGRISRESSTRTTVTRETPSVSNSSTSRQVRSTGSFSRQSSGFGSSSRPASTFSPGRSNSGSSMGGSSHSGGGRSGGGGSFGGRR
jgi:hypothetical protein